MMVNIIGVILQQLKSNKNNGSLTIMQESRLHVNFLQFQVHYECEMEKICLGSQRGILI